MPLQFKVFEYCKPYTLILNNNMHIICAESCMIIKTNLISDGYIYYIPLKCCWLVSLYLRFLFRPAIRKAEKHTNGGEYLKHLTQETSNDEI